MEDNSFYLFRVIGGKHDKYISVDFLFLISLYD